MKLSITSFLFVTATVSAQRGRGPPSFSHGEGPFRNQLSIKLSDESNPIVFEHNPRINQNDNSFVGRSGSTTVNVLRMKNGPKDDFFASVVDESDGMVYQIAPDADGVLVTTEIHTNEFLPELDPEEFTDVDSSGRRDLQENNQNMFIDDSSNSRNLQVDDGSVLDVMVVWTWKAECSNSGLPKGCTRTATTHNNMLGRINLAILETNTAYTSSGVLTQLRLAHAYLDASYDEDIYPKYADPLYHITNIDGIMDDIHTKRAEHHADLVAMINDKTGACGVAWLGPNKSRMFSVTRWSCATGYYSFGHEIGHNMGCNHDKGTSGACSSSNYNYGWRDPQARFRSILAYNCVSGQCDNNTGGGCTRVQMFSNNEYLYNGSPIGSATIDNARQINNVRLAVAQYFINPSTAPSMSPSILRGEAPSNSPVEAPSKLPSSPPVPEPSNSPVEAPSKSPIGTPSKSPTQHPTISRAPTKTPTQKPVKTRPTKPPKNSGPTKPPVEKPTKPPKNSGPAKGKKDLDTAEDDEKEFRKRHRTRGNN